MVSPTDSQIKKAGQQAYEQYLAGKNRETVLAQLEEKYGNEGVFAFGQCEYYRTKKHRPKIRKGIHARSERTATA